LDTSSVSFSTLCMSRKPKRNLKFSTQKRTEKGHTGLSAVRLRIKNTLAESRVPDPNMTIPTTTTEAKAERHGSAQR